MPSARAPARILVVDDVPEFCQSIRAMLKPVYPATTVCGSPLRAIRLLRQEPFDLLITTLVMRELGGLDLIRRVRGEGHSLPIVMITGYGSEQTAIEATRLGASDYLEKPVAPEELLARLRKLFKPAASGGIEPRPDALISEDLAMQSVFDMIDAVARSDSRVLILGETGTGKQLVAQAIHARSPRSDEPWVEVNCAAIPENLLESELFGHERGAFTGAAERRIGRFEEAGRGTLFLDEVGEMGFALQSKLLRVLQNGRFNRVGGQATLQSHARVIAATNRDLQAEIEAGRFRADLYYRLHVISISLPPLRKRPGDVPLLARHFLERYGRSAARPMVFSPEALHWLQRYAWPGNVRELEHLVERLAVLSPSESIGAGELPERMRRDAGTPGSNLSDLESVENFHDARRAFERAFLERSLRRHHGNMAAAAREAGLDRSQYFRLVRKHRLEPVKFRPR